MDSFQIQAVLAVAEKGSFSQAAKIMFSSAPNIRNQIDALEHELGCQLFVRTSSGCVPTDAGERFLKAGAHLLEEMRQVAEFVRTGEERFSLRVLMGLSAASGFTTANHIYTSYLEEHPESSLECVVRERNSHFHDALIDDFADICFVPESLVYSLSPELEFAPCNWWKVTYRCAMPKSSPLADKPGMVTLQDLCSQRVGVVCLSLPRLFEGLPIDERLPFEQAAVYNYCRSGGVCIYGDYFRLSMPILTEKVVDVPGDTMGVVYRKGASPKVMEFVDFATNWTPAAE